jgi:signal transduction histidine kinase
LNILEEIKGNVHKIDGIIKRVLAFFRHADANLTNLQVRSLIEETMRLWTSRVKSCGIELKLALEEDLPDVLGDPIEIQQVLNNLVHNALDAMSEDGLLTVTAEKGRYVFNPFFTTKPSGTGLGLAISHRIVSRHRGVLALASTSEGGTTFCLELSPAPKD